MAFPIELLEIMQSNLTGIIWCGTVSFLSYCWGERVSDINITQLCNFLKVLDPGDVVLADRGFTLLKILLFRNNFLTGCLPISLLIIVLLYLRTCTFLWPWTIFALLCRITTKSTASMLVCLVFVHLDRVCLSSSITLVSRANAHSRISTHVTVLAARIESAHSWASTQVTWARTTQQAPIKYPGIQT